MNSRSTLGACGAAVVAVGLYVGGEHPYIVPDDLPAAVADYVGGTPSRDAGYVFGSNTYLGGSAIRDWR